MDRLSRKVLRFISKREPVSRKVLIDKFGEVSTGSLHYLLSGEYITSDSGRTNPNNRPAWDDNAGPYRISPIGREYLASFLGTVYDRWAPRILPLLSLAVSVAALLVAIFS